MEKSIYLPTDEDSSQYVVFFLFMMAPFLENTLKEKLISKELREFCENYNMDAEEISKHMDELRPIIERDYNKVKDKLKELSKELLNNNK